MDTLQFAEIVIGVIERGAAKDGQLQAGACCQAALVSVELPPGTNGDQVLKPVLAAEIITLLVVGGVRHLGRDSRL